MRLNLNKISKKYQFQINLMKTLKLDKMLYGWIFGFLYKLIFGLLYATFAGALAIYGLDVFFVDVLIELISKLWINFDSFLKMHEIIRVGEKIEVINEIEKCQKAKAYWCVKGINSTEEYKRLLGKMMDYVDSNLEDKLLEAEADVETCKNEYKGLIEKQINLDTYNKILEKQINLDTYNKILENLDTIFEEEIVEKPINFEEEKHLNIINNRKKELILKSKYFVLCGFIIAGVGTAIVIFIEILS